MSTKPSKYRTERAMGNDLIANKSGWHTQWAPISTKPNIDQNKQWATICSLLATFGTPRKT